MTKNAIFIAATGQNVGKTTLCLGIIAALKKRYPSVGFIKPVGQQHIKVESHTEVDKDVVLFKKQFHLSSSWSDMSPVIIPAGFTRDFIDGKASVDGMQKKVRKAFDKINSTHAYTIVEGTGNVGVGSIINLNNAQTASLLDLEMIIITSGGLGSAYDELMMNIAMCKQYGVKIRGVILNKVLDEKREMILNYFPKTLEKWGIPLVGAVPYNAFLSNPTIKDFEHLFSTQLLSGAENRYRHFRNTRLVACSLDAYLDEMTQNELVITPATREDIIQALVQKHIEYAETNGLDFAGGMILTSKHPPSPEIKDKLHQANIPALYAPVCSYDAMKMITSYNAKIRWEDVPKVEQAIQTVEEHIDLDLLCIPDLVEF